MRFRSLVTLCLPLALFAVLVLGGATVASAADSVQSDEFNSAALDTALWRFVDPVGDATLTMNGSQAEIALPAGSSHDLWTFTNSAVRLLQDIPDQDFEVEVKLDSAMGAPYQLQGIIVQQDADDLLRLEIHHDGNATRLFAAVIASGVASSQHYSTVTSGAPAYLRVKREGNQWILRHSLDGTNWTSAPAFTHAMTVTSVGPFVGNSGSPAPAFVGKIDHFRVVSATPVPPADATPPVITGVTTAPGSVAATVTWTTDEPATSAVAYGPTSAYESGTVSSTELTLSHRALLRDLSCGTQYHLQLRSQDAAGNQGETADATFSTGACSTSIRTDQFNAASLDTGIWTLVDPLGDSTLSMSGTQVRLGVPAGTAHDVWTGVDTVPRLLQPVPNADFEVEVKFDNAVGAAYQQQGLIVEQDSRNLLRLEFHHDGGATRLFAAALNDGTASVKHWGAVQGGAPMYLRVERAGNDWTLSYSTNAITWTTGATFTHALTVRALGPLAGNGGSPPPAFTSAIDYFREVLPDTTPPVVSETAASPGTISATIAWTTDELATSRVAFGSTTAYELGTQSTNGFRTSHSLVLHGVRCGMTYHFQVRSADLAGNAAAAPDGTFTTAACPSALTSDDFNSSTLDTNRWLWVDPVGDANVSSSGTQAVISVPAGRSHDLWTGTDDIPRLLQAAPDDDFEIEVRFDSAVTTRYQMEGLLVQQDARNLLRLEVHNDGNVTNLFVAGLTNGTAAAIHEVAVEGGQPVVLRLKRKGSTWTIRYSNDGESWISRSFSRTLAVGGVGVFAGNGGSSPPGFSAAIDYFRYIPPDRTPPVLSGITAAPQAIAAKVSWTTDEPATTSVAYGVTPAYENGTAAKAGERRNHELLLHGLRCATTYHYQVRSADADGNVANSPDQTLTTANCPTSLVTDEFDSTEIDTSLWTYFNPLEDGTATANGSQVLLSVPAGTAHDVWSNVDTLPRLLQATPAGDFEVEAKFDSSVSTQYQQQGIIVEQDAENLIRTEVHFEGQETKLFVATILDGTATIKHHRVVTAGSATYLRLARSGAIWTVKYSQDAESWTTFRFEQAFASTAIGPFGGNGGSSPPTFTAKVAYFRVVPPPPPDTTPPTTTSIAALAHRVSATITWSTDELASSRVDWGMSSAYGQTASAAGPVTAHRLRATGLSCATTYHYRIRSTDAAGNEAVSSDRTFTTGACIDGPSIAVWDGSSQTFGTVGVPQRWINIRGNAEDPDGISSLSYRLNNGANQALLLGPSDDRLIHPGDFNIELDYGELRPGTNNVEIKALDTAGNFTTTNVQVDWQGNTNTQPSPVGPVLIVAAHPDDEVLGFAGIIRKAKLDGRRVYVALMTNGDSGAPGTATGYCGAATGSPAAAAGFGLRRDGEARAALGVLGLQWTASLATTELIFLGYPDGKLREVAGAGTGSPEQGDATGLHRTYAEDFDGSITSCNGDFRYLLSGQHSPLTASALAADLEALVELTQPSDIYTHSNIDGHPDHSKTFSSLTAAITRRGDNIRVHWTLIHPEGTEFCQPWPSAAFWPNPILENDDPFARFTPTLLFTAPFTPTCSSAPDGQSWGSEGPPTASVLVPQAMQATTEADNLKWQAISKHESQINCTPNPDYHVNCGYMRAFVKKNEFFWTRLYSPRKPWPTTYTAHWTSTASIAEQAQIMDGQWTFDGAGIRPVSTGFDRLITLGDMRWTDYEVTARITFNSFDFSRPVVGSAVGLALGWQGHTAWGQPRFGHPSGGLCLYSWDAANPIFFNVTLGYSPGEAHDTIVARSIQDYPLGVPHTMRFRERALGNGLTRYSCKVWQTSKPEPSAWTVEADIPDWEGETGTHPGSVVLVAHMADATFGDVTIAPVGG